VGDGASVGVEEAIVPSSPGRHVVDVASRDENVGCGDAEQRVRVRDRRHRNA
jgi:hypothetical protein